MRFLRLLYIAAGACGRVGFEATSLTDAAGDAAGDGVAVEACAGVAADTVALYTFDGALGDDASGDHPGVSRGGVASGEPRCGASSARFTNGDVLIPDDAAFDLATGSVSLFVRLATTATDDNQIVLARDAVETETDGHFAIIITPGADIVARLQFAGVSNYRCATGFPANAWVHIGVSFGGEASQGFRMWIDHVPALAPTATVGGAQVGCTTPIGAGLAGNDNTLVIGAGNTLAEDGTAAPVTAQHVLDGEIDHVHLRASWRDFGDD